MAVHSLNDKKQGDEDAYKSLLLLDEIAKDNHLSQRDLSSRLNIALGLVNSYIKNLASKGYITIKAIPPRRFAYFLTPKGFTEKTRLTYHHFQNFTNLYRVARKDFKELFARLYEEGAKSIVFAGCDESAEIAYLSLQEFNIIFAGIADGDCIGRDFFRHKVMPIDWISEINADIIIISSFLKKDAIYNNLLERGFMPERIKSIFPLGKITVSEEAVI